VQAVPGMGDRATGEAAAPTEQLAATSAQSRDARVRGGVRMFGPPRWQRTEAASISRWADRLTNPAVVEAGLAEVQRVDLGFEPPSEEPAQPACPFFTWA
jgi:hypothetical protein